MNFRLSIIIGAIGRTLIGLGLIVLAFAGYQLWGTGLLESRSQNALEAQFAERQAALAALSASTTTTPPTTAPPTTAPPTTATGPEPTVPTSPPTLPVVVAPSLAADLWPSEGEPLGHIRIPSIGLDRVIVEGVSRNDLRQGPGHYRNTPFPGQAGNAAIAGHRTTYGQPFYDLDKVQPGDLIEVETLQGLFTYQVMTHTASDGSEAGHFIVEPSRVEVVDDFGDNRLTLTACHPKRSARQRIVVTGLLVGSPAPTVEVPEESTSESTVPEDANTINDATAGTTGVDELAEEADESGGEASINSLDESLGWHMENLRPTLLWGALTALVFLAGWLIGRAWRRWPAYLAIAPVFLATLFVSFMYLDRMLPAF